MENELECTPHFRWLNSYQFPKHRIPKHDILKHGGPERSRSNMPNLLLSIVMATMASMSTTMLGLGQGSFALPALTVLAASTSVVFTDWLGWFRLNRVVANLAMLMAAFFSLWGFLESGSQQQLWAIANLLIYVQMVLLFQGKNRRVYGQLAMFSLLQVVVAALLNRRLEFGVLLSLYMVIALLSFVLFFVYREVGSVGMVSRRRFWFDSPAPVTVASVFEQPNGHAPGQPVIQVVEYGADLNHTIVTRRIAPPILAMLVATIVFTTVFFYTTPRSGGTNWQRGLGGTAMVGFSPEVSFDQMEKLLRSDKRVMRVSFTDVRTGEAYTVMSEPYLRGAILTKYINGRWQQEIRTNRLPTIELGPPPKTRDLVRQDVLLEPTGNARLFSMFPAYALEQTPRELRVDPRTRHLFRQGAKDRDIHSEYRYTLVTTAFRYGAQNPVTPYPNRLETAADRVSMKLLNRWMRNINSPESLPKLIALANRIVQQQTPQGNSYERARALEYHFLDPGQYTYTLDLDEVKTRRHAEVDPIEDFISNHRTGHCEYFASALTLMLRSQGIPARMVIGFRPSEFNFVGNYYVVRQQDAHAWVEAYLQPDEIPQGAIYPEERHAGGGWLRLDPTPGSELTGRTTDMNLLDRASNSFDYARWLWNDYVLRLTEERQRKAVLDPLALDRQSSTAQLFDARTWKRLAKRVTSTSPRELLQSAFSWRAGVAAVFACVAVYFGIRLLRLARPLLGRALQRRTRAKRRRHQRITIAFYQQLEAALARIGMRRGASQTQRHFAAEAAQRLAASPEYVSAAAIPQQIADTFYLVRFGHATLGPQQEATLRQQLSQLEATLAN